MFLHFHKLTTELFNSIKTQQINVFNASVDTNANCLCHIVGAIKSGGLLCCVQQVSESFDRDDTQSRSGEDDTERVFLQLSVCKTCVPMNV